VVFTIPKRLRPYCLYRRALPGPTIRANADQMRQVLTNLATNAWEAGSSGRAEIQVTVKAVTAAAVSLAHRVPPDWQPLDPAYACLEVVDQGCGVAEADIEKLFDPFFSSKFTGRSTFRVYLPVSEA
jgi:signal transduction histidine kinase